MFYEKQKRIEIRCNLKDKQIAYFNSLNAAIALLGISQAKDKKAFIKKWRDWFLEEWAEWYAKETTPQPVSQEDALRANQEFEERLKEDKTIELANELLQQEAEAEKLKQQYYEEQNNST